jgi:hypothetical protein
VDAPLPTPLIGRRAPTGEHWSAGPVVLAGAALTVLIVAISCAVVRQP